MRPGALVLFVLFSSFGSVHAQDPPYALVDSIRAIGPFTTDPIGNVYFFNRGDLVKYSTAGIETNKYSRRDYGDIGYVDASNPMKILVVYPEFSRAVILDAALSPQTEIQLSFPGIPFVKLLCLSKERGFWYFNPVERNLVRMSDQLVPINEGTRLNQVIDVTTEPEYLGDSGDWLVLYVPGYGILVFDRYGTYFKTVRTMLPLKGIRASGNQLVYQEEGVVVRTDIRTGQSERFAMPGDSKDSECRIEGHRMFIRSGDQLKIYSF